MSAILRILGWLETGIPGLLALGAAGLMVSESVIRYTFPAALPDWGAEVTIYLIGWAVMLCASRLIREHMHVGVDMVINNIPAQVQRLLAIFTCLLGIAVSAAIVYGGYQMVDFAILLGERGDSSIRFPMWLYYLAIPVGFALTGGQYLIRLGQLLLGRA